MFQVGNKMIRTSFRTLTGKNLFQKAKHIAVYSSSLKSIPIITDRFEHRSYKTNRFQGSLYKKINKNSIILINNANTARLFSNEKDNKNEKKPVKSSRFSMIASLGLGASFLFGKLKFVLVALKITKVIRWFGGMISYR